MNKKTIKIAGWALGLSMAIAGIEMAVGNHTSLIETKADSLKSRYDSASNTTIKNDNNCSSATVKIGETTITTSAIKAGTSKNVGSVKVTLPANTNTFYLYAVGGMAKRSVFQFRALQTILGTLRYLQIRE